MAGINWSHHDWHDASNLTPAMVNAVRETWPTGTTFERKDYDWSHPLFGRLPEEVGSWKVFHWRSRRDRTDAYMVGGPQVDERREFAAPYWLLMVPFLLPAAWWLWCPPGRAFPRLTIGRLGLVTVVMALACWTLVAFARSSARDRALSVISELDGKILHDESDNSVIDGLDFTGGRNIDYLDDAQARRLRAALTHLPRLKKLRIGSRTLTATGFALLADQPDLEDLWLASTNADDQTLSYLLGHRKLREINLDDAKVTDAGLAHLREMPALEVLWLEDLPITDAGLTHLEGLPRLRKVFARDSQSIRPGAVLRGKITAEGVGRFSRATPSLEFFVLPDGRRMARQK